MKKYDAGFQEYRRLLKELERQDDSAMRELLELTRERVFRNKKDISP
jgi:hypothetical protein